MSLSTSLRRNALSLPALFFCIATASVRDAVRYQAVGRFDRGEAS